MSETALLPMVPVACSEPGAVCIQLPEKVIVTPRVFSAVTVKGPGPIVISMKHTIQVIVDPGGYYL